ncbi:LytR/AlgR family response regulator transcription factor [Larkinella sp. GY13]|uniref:LytR/AlgR family response regulator transcription factor n=1 Tax=Larkinella sp. GY13 TaxID=3453720 RepID=UPI003EEB44ED
MILTALIADDELIARQLIKSYLAHLPHIQVVGEAGNGSDAVLQTIQHKPNLLFLDVQMPELNGFEALKELWPHHQPYVIFVTAYDKYALKAFEVNAIDYLLKPFDEDRFRQAIDRVVSRMGPQPPSELTSLLNEMLRDKTGERDPYLKRMLVKEGRRMSFVKLSDVMYLHSDSNYITLQTRQQGHIVYESLTLLEQRLDPSMFVRINRSYIINLDYVLEVETYFNGEYNVKMTNGQVLKWTRFYRDNIKAFYARKN